jgi:hypothetical protein
LNQFYFALRSEQFKTRGNSEMVHGILSGHAVG